MKTKLTTSEVPDNLFMAEDYSNWPSEQKVALTRYHEQLKQELGEDVDIDVAAMLLLI